jgi:hypothetical protein
MRVSIRALMCVLELELEASNFLSNGLHLYCLTGFYYTNRVMECSFICDVISTAGELGMTIITLGRLYFVFSCRLAPTDVVSMQHRRRVVAGDLTESHLQQE